MEKYIEILEAERLETLDAYLVGLGLKDYNLTPEEKKALDDFENASWKEFNLEALFGKSTRGRRLKSDDRIAGGLPFVTAGETDTGISAWIGNDVQVFPKNTVTIDMFGSAKYRNYDYGADDHVAVVHTSHLDKFSSLFLTSAIHKSAHAGQFDYSENFYASDADELTISLPINSAQEPDYTFMQNYVSAVQKTVIKDVVVHLDKRLSALKGVLSL
ncbi:phosphoribosylglycinamide formyltransferase [Acetobacteraceae bacterium]|nr:phosphoribosylglycinamide formyltransferase [Acetobacteraceae bacterium]